MRDHPVASPWSLTTPPDEPEADLADSVDQVAALLRQDPVVIQTVMGAGNTKDAYAALTNLLHKTDTPTYVALVGELDGLGSSRPAEDLATQLHGRIGKDACYVASVGRSTASACFGVDVDDDADTWAVHEDVMAALPSEYHLTPAGFAAEEIVTLARLDLDLVTEPAAFSIAQDVRPPAERTEASDPNVPLLLTALVAVAVLMTVRTALWRVASVRESLSQARNQATGRRRETTRKRDDRRSKLLERYRTLTTDPRRQRAALADEDLSSRALEQAGRLLEPSPGRDVAADDSDELDLVGAQVLIRIADRALDASDPTPYRACWFNPTHGEATSEATAKFGHLPCCGKCRRALDRGERPQVLMDRGRPYYDGSSVWASTGFGAMVPDLPAALSEHRHDSRGEA